MLETELFALLERTSDAAFSVTEEGQIQSWNKSAEKLFGYSRSQALHKTCYQLLEGFGPLGTRVCHQHCSVAECAGKNASEQEKQILRLFAEGKSSAHIARTLHISSSTLRNHLHHINQKLRTHNRLEAVMNAIQRKLI
jgi:DNA-binding CsgD family transcriptional regulator